MFYDEFDKVYAAAKQTNFMITRSMTTHKHGVNVAILERQCAYATYAMNVLESSLRRRFRRSLTFECSDSESD
jgi:hypothetical protein